MSKLDEARAFFARDRFATKATGIEIDEIGENYAKCSMKICISCRFSAAPAVRTMFSSFMHKAS